MKYFWILCCISAQLLVAQGNANDNCSKGKLPSLYIKTFGNCDQEPVIFLHGGPGFNCANFEASTAQKLADNGFFVIVYDRRAEGRSTGSKAAFTFKETFDDINSILKAYRVKKVNLVGHSFGGIVGTLYTKAYPTKVKTLILASAPVSLQESFKTIISSCKAIYEADKDSNSLFYLHMLEKMDRSSMEFASYCFYHAMGNRFYSTKNKTEEATVIYNDYKASKLYEDGNKMTAEGPQGFSDHEKYTTLNLTADIQSLVNQHIRVFGLYGKEDGLYSEKQVTDLANIIGTSNLRYMDNCSHNVFMDQQGLFIGALKEWCK
jgi:proline iminopeptidase